MTRADAKRIALAKVRPKYKTYHDPHYPSTEFLLGFKGDNFLDMPLFLKTDYAHLYFPAP